MSDRPNERLEVSCVVDDCCRGYFESLIRVSVDCCGEGAEFFVKLVLKILHGLDEVPFGDKRVGVGGVAHCLDFVCYGLSYGCVSKADCCVVGVRAINTSSVWYEIYTSPEYEC